MTGPPFVDDASAALLTDLYELTMLEAYRAEGMDADAVMSLFARRLPKRRSFLLACGLDDALRHLEHLRFDADSLDYLRRLERFRPDFLEWLGELRFEGDVWAVPEGTPVFAGEPWLEVVAPIAEAQIAETFLMNQMHLQTVLATKAWRVVRAARGRPVVDFGLRRMHGTDAGMKAARAFAIAGVAATSNVLAGKVYGLRVSGTMAHSYIEAHDTEEAALRAFAAHFPGTTLLVDTYDTLEGVRKVAALCKQGLDIGAVRLDSGDLAALAHAARRILDAAGLMHVEIFASGSLDEDRVAALVGAGAPIDAFGVGTRMGVSADAPYLDCAYKLTEYAGRGRVKLSPGKAILPGRKQVFRVEKGGVATHDVLAQAGEEVFGRPLMLEVMHGGRRTDAGRDTIEAARDRAKREIARLPERLLALDPPDRPYEVRISEALARAEREAEAQVR